MGLTELAAVLAVTGAVVLVVRGWDVRLVLLAAALVTAVACDAVRGRLGVLTAVVLNFLATFSNEKFVVPICSAMGFAYVLRHTGCERHLVLLLTAPLRRVRWLLVPGVVLVGFLVNIPVISQTSTAVCIGPVVVPLMRAAGYSFPTIGACLLLGASVGGELLNPGAPELLTVAKVTKVTTQEQVSRYLPGPVFVQLAVSLAVLWVLSRWWEKTPESPGTAVPESAPEPPPEKVNFLKALVPLVPLVLLFLAGPPLHALDVPDAWVAAPKDGARDIDLYSTRLIGLAMLVGVLVAMAVTPGKARDGVTQFFAGAGYGFANIVSLIVTATCFGKAIEGAGLAAALGRLITDYPDLLQPLAAFVPLAFAAVSGSGMASTQSLYGFFFQPAVDLGHDPTAVGALVGVGSAAGRTMSPVAAVTLMCATLTHTNPFVLAKRVALPLLAGVAAVVALRMAGVV
ncbi:MAG TPA: C4-dicarboxylate transporter DcuC [Urbifossiella sp.]|nr:C4-dicarboxylate transporter DcuC [Urbifossiella sp.]